MGRRSFAVSLASDGPIPLDSRRLRNSSNPRAPANVLLQSIAAQFGYNPADPSYYLKFRNPVLSFLTGERLLILYSEKGIGGMISEVQELRDRGII